MPNYHYLCHNLECRHEFEIYQSIKDNILTVCPACGHESILRVLYASTVIVNEPRTIGSLADRNTAKLGKDTREEMWGRQEEAKQKAREAAYEKLSEKLPVGASLPSAKAPEGKTWYRESPTPNVALADLTPKQQKNYITTGKT